MFWSSINLLVSAVTQATDDIGSNPLGAIGVPIISFLGTVCFIWCSGGRKSVREHIAGKINWTLATATCVIVGFYCFSIAQVIYKDHKNGRQAIMENRALHNQIAKLTSELGDVKDMNETLTSRLSIAISNPQDQKQSALRLPLAPSPTPLPSPAANPCPIIGILDQGIGTTMTNNQANGVSCGIVERGKGATMNGNITNAH